MQLKRLQNIFQHIKNHDYIGESISQYEHSLQCAYFAETLNHSEDVVIASLLHDIGHVALNSPQPQMADLGVINHEWIGARLALELGFSKKIAYLIGYHVTAKRYLAAKKSAYLHKLSDASLGTLTFQGGTLPIKEQGLFESLPFFKEALQVRTNDEKGKVCDLKLPHFDHYMSIIDAHLRNHCHPKGPKQIYCTLDHDSPAAFPDSVGIVLSGFKPSIGEDIIFDYNLSVSPTDPHFFIFLDESMELIKQSVVRDYGLIISKAWYVNAISRYPDMNFTLLDQHMEYA